MSSIKRRAAYYLAFITVLVIVSAVVYDVGMRVFEPTPYPPDDVEISFFHSLQVVVETFTATGYGSDSPWHSPEMNVLVMVLDLTGVGLFFLALPAVLLPLFQRALSPSPPTEAQELSDHVVICTHSPRAEVLVEELDSRGVAYLLAVPDADQALELDRAGYEVVHADPESVSELRRTNVSTARAVVADVSDRIDASIVLAVREIDESVRVISVVEEPEHESYHRLAGADEVLTPRALLGNRLAAKLATGVSVDLGDSLSLGEDVDLMEVPIRHGSPLSGTTLAESQIRERFGVNVIGAWFHGELQAPLSPTTTLDGGTVLLVTGSRDQLDALDREVRSPVRRFRRGDAVVLGHGEVGKTITAALEREGIPYTVVDHKETDEVDIVGDATNIDTLEAADVHKARSVVIAMPDETVTEFTTLVARDLNDTAEIVARADDREAIRKTYRAGADYVLSLATVTGRSIASAVLEDENVLSIGSTVSIIETTAPPLTGQTIAEANVRERTGCTVVSVERNGDLVTDLDPDFRFEEGDELVVAGTDEGTNTFVEQFGP